MRVLLICCELVVPRAPSILVLAGDELQETCISRELRIHIYDIETHIPVAFLVMPLIISSSRPLSVLGKPFHLLDLASLDIKNSLRSSAFASIMSWATEPYLEGT